MSRNCNWNSRAYATASDGPSPGPFWPSGGVPNGGSCRSWWRLGPFGVAAMVMGFIIWWPIGLGILFYNMMRRGGAPVSMAEMMERAKAPFASRESTGNAAFDDWRRAEIERIERERQKLADAEREFSIFVDELRRAKDREEFERFMQARKARPAEPGIEQ